jgi:hypothetical protein
MRWTGTVACIGERRVRTGFWWGNLREGDNLEDLGVDGDTIKTYVQELAWRNMNWICLAQGRNRLRVVVNAVMNFRIP